MAQNYKLCQNCNNALDFNVTKCPYCGRVIGFDLSKGSEGFVKTLKNIEKTTDKKQTSGCVKFIIFFIIIQVIGTVLSLIFQIIASLM